VPNKPARRDIDVPESLPNEDRRLAGAPPRETNRAARATRLHMPAIEFEDMPPPALPPKRPLGDPPCERLAFLIDRILLRHSGHWPALTDGRGVGKRPSFASQSTAGAAPVLSCLREYRF
jgi:hypothetical protein